MLAQNLTRLREQRGLTQKELADQLHVVRQTVSKWEKGHSVPDADMVLKLADFFGVSTDELLGVEAPEPMNLDELSLQTAVLNAQIQAQNERFDNIMGYVKRTILVIVILMLSPIIFVPLANSGCAALYSIQDPNANMEEVVYHLDGHAYHFTMNLDPNDSTIATGYNSDDPTINEINPEQYLDTKNGAAELTDAIVQYVESKGGTIARIQSQC